MSNQHEKSPMQHFLHHRQIFNNFVAKKNTELHKPRLWRRNPFKAVLYPHEQPPTLDTNLRSRNNIQRQPLPYTTHKQPTMRRVVLGSFSIQFLKSKR